jgi:hypothetical protein
MKLNYNSDAISFEGFTPASMPGNTLIGVSAAGDLIVNMPFSGDTPVTLNDQKICDYYFNVNNAFSGVGVSVMFSEAFVIEENSAAYPNLDECELSLAGGQSGPFSVSSMALSSGGEILEGEKWYVCGDSGAWKEIPEETGEETAQMPSLIQPLVSSSVYRLNYPSELSEYVYNRDGLLSDR